MSTAGSTMSIAAARLDDLPAIMGLEVAGFTPNERWSERSWQGELLGDGRTTLLARTHVPVGVIALQTVGDVADLHRLVVSPRHRRQGIGAALVGAGLEAVRHAGARSVMLEVAWDNDPAIALYQRLGFEQLTARDDYYGPGRHALILRLWDLASWSPTGQSDPEEGAS
ncbi:MAG TPA: N-acetyltransferase [Microlunatus sp.]|jgi:ribosomal-protein-alanine N-acetyltransferase|nr:N-acetyltransferase [Microlunatus sp.]